MVMVQLITTHRLAFLAILLHLQSTFLPRSSKTKKEKLFMDLVLLHEVQLPLSKLNDSSVATQLSHWLGLIWETILPPATTLDSVSGVHYIF